MKKIFIFGFIIGVSIVVLQIFGLVVPLLENIIPPLTYIPRLITDMFINTQTASGGVSIGALLLVSGLFYGVVFWIVSRIARIFIE